MGLHDFGWLLIGMLLGWITKIPWFLKNYSAWERDRDAIRKWMKSHDSNAPQ